MDYMVIERPSLSFTSQNHTVGGISNVYRWRENQRQHDVPPGKPSYEPLATVLLQKSVGVGENNG